VNLSDTGSQHFNILYHCCPVNYLLLRFFTSFKMTFSGLDLWEWGWLAALPPTNPIPTLKMKNTCHSERSEESKMFLPDTSDFVYMFLFSFKEIENIIHFRIPIIVSVSGLFIDMAFNQPGFVFSKRIGELEGLAYRHYFVGTSVPKVNGCF
jgi:hypothetical protein